MFDELKIRNLLNNNLSVDDFSKLTSKVMHDPRVIKHMLKCDSRGISLLKDDVSLKLVQEDSGLVKSLSVKQLNRLFARLDLEKIDIDQDLFLKLEHSKQDLVFRYDPFIYFNLIPEDKRKDKIREFILANKGNNNERKRYSCYLLEESDLNKMILSLEDKDILFLLKSSSVVRDYIRNLYKNLEYEEALKVYEKCDSFLNMFNRDVRMKIRFKDFDDNLDSVVKMVSEDQIYFFSNHLSFLRYASKEIIFSCLERLCLLEADYLTKFDCKFSYDFLKKNLVVEEYDKLIDYDFLVAIRGGYRGIDEIVKRKLAKLNDKDKSNYLYDFYCSLSTDYIEDRGLFGIFYERKFNIARMICDDNIINNNSIGLLERYSDTLERDLLVEILTNAYGEHVREIFDKRPNLKLLDINNFKVFDKRIYDVLGKEFVNYFLDYDMVNLNYLISKLANESDSLEAFKKYFDCMTANKKDLDINYITNLMHKFRYYEDVIKEIDFDNISEERKRNLELFTSDDEDISIIVSSLNDLDNYLEGRKRRFLDIVSEHENISIVRNCIFAYVTGRGISNDNEVSLDSLALDKAIKVFNIERIVDDLDISKKIGLTNEEVAMLLLLHETSRIDDKNVLKDTFDMLMKKDLDSLVFGAMFDKIRSYYTEDIKNNILSKENLDRMSKRKVSGVEVIDLNGQDFTLICSVLGVNLSSGGGIITDYGYSLLNDWLNRENGVGTISTSLCSSDTDIYPLYPEQWDYLKNNIIFVFGKDIDILGMGSSDIYSTHTPKSNKHNFMEIAENEFCFSTMGELKDAINKNRISAVSSKKFQSEITIARKKEDIRFEMVNRRMMPIGMYVIGDISSEMLVTARIFNDYYEQNELGKFRIIRVNPEKYKKEEKVESSFSSVRESRK